MQFRKLSQPLLETIHAAATIRGHAGQRLLADRNYPPYGVESTHYECDNALVYKVIDRIEAKEYDLVGTVICRESGLGPCPGRA